jgi:hypothetical protein
MACVALLAMRGAVGTSAQWPAMPDTDAWTLQYHVSGGFMGRAYAVTLRHDGTFVAYDSWRRYKVQGVASDDLMEHARAALLTLHESTGGRSTRADVPTSSLVVMHNGRAYAVANPGELVSDLKAAFDAAVQTAVTGTWSQAGWKLCTPAAQLTRADVDVPIDTLDLRPDGTFVVIWTAASSRERTALHYDGTWRIDIRAATFHIDPTPGLQVPRDVRGDGRFGIFDDRLTLTNVWFGTRRPAHTPDVCELSFARAARR